MANFPIEPSFLDHRRFAEAGPAAELLWVRCGVWCSREENSGIVPAAIVKRFGRLAEARKLVKVELWEETEDGFQFLRWREHAGSPELSAVERKRERDREYQRNRRKRQKGDASPVVDVAPVSDDASRDNRATVRRSVARLDTASSLEVPPLYPPQGETSQPPAANPPKPKTEKRASQLPASWSPLPRHAEFAAKEHLDLDDQVTRFREHHGFKGTLGKDWNLGFDTWLRNAVRFRQADVAQRPAAKPEVTRADLKPYVYRGDPS